MHVNTSVRVVEIERSAPQVVGHTIQEQGINSACAEQVFRIDVGMSKGCGNGEPEVMISSLASVRIGAVIHLDNFAADTMIWLF